ncbi:MAG: MBL fold metallo-hydrolase [Bacteroidales bacterium]|nr:MBL fold metallo-hydrolase [Bacteroidales bacterium]
MKIYRRVFSPIEVNTYIITDPSGDCIIIDCSCYDDEEFRILKSLLESKKLKPVLLLNTHCHFDHVFGNHFMLEYFNLKTICNEEEISNLKNAPLFAEMCGLNMNMPPDPDHFIKDGEYITAGSITLKALHVPGHTTGSMAYYCKEGSCIFTGDALFAGQIGRCDLPGGDQQMLIKSIKEKILTLPPSTIVHPGHGKHTTVENEKITNPWLN